MGRGEIREDGKGYYNHLFGFIPQKQRSTLREIERITIVPSDSVPDEIYIALTDKVSE